MYQSYMKADNHTESNVGVCAALRCPGNLTVKSKSTLETLRFLAECKTVPV